VTALSHRRGLGSSPWDDHPIDQRADERDRGADREGNIIARLPHPEALVGKNMRKSHEAIMDGDTTGTEEAKGVMGSCEFSAICRRSCRPTICSSAPG
jgi:hypothetical protein